VKDMHNNFVVVVVVKGFLESKDKLYTFYEFPKKYPSITVLIAQIDDWSRIWHE
jgi:hypothetical protein